MSLTKSSLPSGYRSPDELKAVYRNTVGANSVLELGVLPVLCATPFWYSMLTHSRYFMLTLPRYSVLINSRYSTLTYPRYSVLNNLSRSSA